MTTIGYRLQTTEGIHLPKAKSAPSTHVTEQNASTTEAGAGTTPGVQIATTSQTKLKDTARAIQQAVQELGEEFIALEKQLRDESSALIKQNPIRTAIGNRLEQTSEAMNFRLSAGGTNPKGRIRQLATRLLEKRSPSLNEEGATFQYAHLVDQSKLELKLMTLLSYCPELAEVMENAAKGKFAAAVGHMASSSAPAGIAIKAIDDMYAQMLALHQAGNSDDEIAKTLAQATRKVEASGGIFGRVSAWIKEKPGNNDKVDAKTVANWIAKGKRVETTEPVRYGFVNKSEGVVTTADQTLLENWLKVAGLESEKFPANTPLLLRECADREQFSEKAEEPLRERLIVNQPFEAIDPRKVSSTPNASETTPLLPASSAARIAVDIEQVPMLLPLKYVICGREDLVHDDLLRILDDAKLAEAVSHKHPEFAEEISHALRNPDNAEAMRLHRKLAAAELMNTFLEGGSAWETAKDVAPYAGAGMLVEGIKNLVPDGPLKSVVTELFLGGADFGDNGMGCLSELRSQAATVKGIEVGGIADLYEKTFNNPDDPEDANKPAPNMMTALSHLALLGMGAHKPDSSLASIAKATGFKEPKGPLASITETQMKSFLTGSAVSVGMTTVYSAAGALSSNPAVLALFGAGAIMGTSISPAIGFAMLHAELALAVKKRLYDGTLQAPEDLDMNDHAAVTDFCRKEAMNQLMMQTGNGAGNIAFLLAPLASSAKLLGFVVPQELIDFALEPLMPGMENIVRVGAMDSHEASKREAIKKIKEKCINEAAKGNATPMTPEEFDQVTINALDKIAANWSLTIADPFVRLLGGADYPHLVPVENVPERTPVSAGSSGEQAVA